MYRDFYWRSIVDKETLRELASMLREQYVNPADLPIHLAMDLFARGKVAGALELIEAIERLVIMDEIVR